MVRRLIVIVLLAQSALAVSVSAQVPTLISPANGATDVPVPVGLDWSDLAGADRYRVQVSSSIIFLPLRYDEQVTKSNSTASILSPGIRYYWRVRGGIDTLGTTYWGDWSAIWSFTTCPVIPQPLQIFPSEGLTVDPGQVVFSWHSVPIAYQYDIDVFLNTAGGYEMVWAVRFSDTTIKSPEFLNAGRYKWTVQTLSEFCGASELAEVHFWIGPCCEPPTMGNVDCEGIVDIGDVTELITLLFIRVGDPFCCEAEADLDYNGDIDIGDLTILINRLFITVTDPPPCP